MTDRDHDNETPVQNAAPGISRRTVGTAALGAAVSGAAVGFGADRLLRSGDDKVSGAVARASASSPSAVVDPFGPHQAGIAAPVVAPSYLRLVVADLREVAAARTVVADLGRTLAAATTGRHPQLAGIAPARLTVNVAVGPRVVSSLGRDLPGADQLPVFAGDRAVVDARRGGDLAVQLAADDPVLVAMAGAVVQAQLARQARLRWVQDGFRGPAVGSAARNVVGFVDGISVPHGEAELDEQVWLPAPARLAGGTILAVRRFRINVAAFTSRPVADQEADIGRRRHGSAPLSGGSIDSDPDLGSKTPDGQYRIPAMSHLRRAHPLTVGAGLMLRRSYSIAGDAADPRPGLLFLSYQRELRTFVATQQRLDDGDDLLRYARADASATFLVLPGFAADTPLGRNFFA